MKNVLFLLVFYAEINVSGTSAKKKDFQKTVVAASNVQTLACPHSLAAVTIDKELTLLMFDYVGSPTFIKCC